MRSQLLCIVACVACLGAAPATRPASRPFSGLTLRDDDTGKVLVAHIAPGPLEGKGFRSPHLERGDTILAINGQPMTAKAFEAMVAAAHIGDEVTVQVRRTGSPVVTAVPTAGGEGAVGEFRFALADATNWIGPVDFPNGVELKSATDAISVSPQSSTPSLLDNFIDEQLELHQLTEPTIKLCDMLAASQQKAWGFNALSHVAYGFVHPKKLMQLEKRISDPLPQIASEPTHFLAHTATLLDVKVELPREAIDFTDPQQAASALAKQLDLAGTGIAHAFEQIDPEQRSKQAEQIIALLAHVALPKTVESAPRVNEFITAMQATMDIDYVALFSAANRVADVLNVTAPTVATASPATAPTTTVAIPEELTAAVAGSILSAQKCNAGWIIVGGAGANTYDISKLAAVIDVGGDDVYNYPDGGRAPVQVILDLAGNDRYVATGSAVGPAAAVMGVSLINDVAGDDIYQGGAISNGAGVMGIGILLDRNGNDQYTSSAWSEGAAAYGTGAIIDLAGGDTYIASIDSQAIGGPKGVGMILDSTGDDVYRANGPIPSAYDTPAVAYAMSQGVGLGFRRYDSGGIGILSDLAGNDRYEGGEFSQGGGYYFGLGLLHDRAGSDIYFGNRYSQAFAAHLAIGILVDDAGDDTYWSMTAAGQSGSWDKCVTLLLDRAGNDTYRGDGLSQGSAAMQAIAWLIDLGGIDHYVAAGTATQGRGGGNTYSYLATGCMSWSMLIDAGGAMDFYSSGRTNDQTLTTGIMNAEHQEASDLSGLFIDTNRTFNVP